MKRPLAHLLANANGRAHTPTCGPGRLVIWVGPLPGHTAVRPYLRRGEGEWDQLAFVIEDDGTIKVRAPTYPTVASLAGAAGSLKHPVSWEEMRQIAREDYLAEEYLPKNP